MPKKLNTIEFIDKSSLIHGDVYDYSLVDYKNNYTKVKIICQEHGIFEQTPNRHLAGTGCSKCSGNCKLNTETFIEKALLIYGDMYDYSLVHYKNGEGKVRIICKIHGVFEKIARAHLFGQGCPQCAKNNLTNQQFINKCILIHGDKYDYFCVEYIDYQTEVKIFCKKHQQFFWQKPAIHLVGSGCQKCAFDRQISSHLSNTQDFIQKVEFIHNYKYDYSLVNYENANTKIKIICPNHGEFLQRASHHMDGHGCPKCISIISKPEIQWLNQMNISEENRNIRLPGLEKLKVDGYDPQTNTIYEFNGDYWHGNPKKYNPTDINSHNHKTFQELYEKTIAREVLIKNAGYKLITIWESDFRNNIDI